MSDLLERITWILINHGDQHPAEVANAVVREIENTHRIIDPDDVTEVMVEASFYSLPEHYSPPDMTRRPWHALKARRRFTAMARAAKKLVD